MEEIVPQFSFSYYDLLKDHWGNPAENCIQWEKVLVHVNRNKSCPTTATLTIEWLNHTGVSGCGRFVTYSISDHDLWFLSYSKNIQFLNWLIEEINTKLEKIPKEKIWYWEDLLSPQDVINYLKSNDWQDKTRQE